MNAPQDPAQPEAPSSAVATIQKPVTRKGKVAHLPKEARDRINQLMSDGFTYLEIIAELGPIGQGLTENNLSNWKDGGYLEWLQEQQRLDRMRVRQEFAKDLVRENSGITSHQAASQIAALNLCDIVDDFEPAILKKALLNDAELYVKLLKAYTHLLNTMPKLSHAEVECEIRRDDQAEHAAQLAKDQPSTKPPGLSDKARHEMENKLNLM